MSEIERGEKPVRKKLSPAEYWEWRTTISEMQVAKEVFKNSEFEHKILMIQAENSVLKAQVFAKTKLVSAKENVENCKKEYDRFKNVLEENLGISLNGKIINEVTFEVQDPPTNE